MTSEIDEEDVAHDDWAKMDARLDSNPKIRRGGRNARDVFLFLLRRNRLLRCGGRLPLANIEHWYLADQLMISEKEAEEGVSRGVVAGLIAIEKDAVVICGFDSDWGGQAPLSDAERSKKYRERHAASRETRDSSRDGRDESDASRRREEKRLEEKREKESTSGKPDIPVLSLVPAAPASDPVGEAAKPVIELLNKLTGKRYAADSDVVLENVRKLLSKKHTVETMLDVVRFKHGQWATDAKMAAFLRPSTLLRPAKFAEYLQDMRAGPGLLAVTNTNQARRGHFQVTGNEPYQDGEVEL